MKTGDIVELKTGGPRMTIEYVYTYQPGKLVGCVWFEGTTLHRINIGEDVLKIVKQ